ncbi:MAG TPA: sulfotransferase [Burkholderiales bacterium]|nr:sulfotransferase [Burkholderiales bacterium]
MKVDEAGNKMRRALELDHAGNLDEAAALCGELLAARPGQPHALCLLGRVRRRQGRLDDAASSLEAARAAAPQMPQLLAELGFLALTRNEPAAAVAHFSALLGQKPATADAHFNLGCALDRAGRHADAALRFEAALELQPADRHEVLARLGGSLLMAGREEAAAARFDEALAIEPACAPAMHGLGMVRGARGEFEAAAALFRQALAADPDFVEVYQQLAEIRRFEDPADPDLVAMRRLLGEPGRSPLAREKLSFALGKASDDLGDYAAAFAHFAEANRLKRERVGGFDRAAHAALIERTIETFSADFFPPRAEFGVPDRTPLPVFGMPRSGTTLVEQILSCHSRVAAGGEQSWLDRLNRSLGAERPRAVLDWGPGEAQRIAGEYLGLLARLGGGSERVTDKMPGNFLHAGLIHLLFPRAALVHCRRDPVDTCLSIFFQDFGTGNLYANDLEDIASFYRAYERLMQHWRAVLPGAIFDVDYAALVRERERVTRELLAFCGLDWEDACLEFDTSERVVATLSRWQVRQPVYADSVGRRDRYAPYIGALEAALAAP